MTTMLVSSIVALISFSLLGMVLSSPPTGNNSLQSKTVRSLASTTESSSPLWNVSVKEAQSAHSQPRVIHEGVGKGEIALTFDDGVSLNTLKVLRILREFGIKATFFIIGEKLEKDFIADGAELKKTPKEIIDLILAEGHEIAAHCYSHPDFLQLSDQEITEQMQKTAELFKSLSGKVPRFMRPPYGYADRRVADVLNDLGYFIVRWSIDTQDWREDTELAVSNFKRAAKPAEQGSSEIVLMHDNQSQIDVYLPQIIEHARSLGYKFVKLSESLGGINPYFVPETPLEPPHETKPIH